MYKLLSVAFSVIAVAISSASVASGSELGDLAASMQPGTWAKLDTNGFNANLVLWGGRHAFQYTDNLTYDPVRDEVHFVGAGHQQPSHHLRYTISDNQWVTVPDTNLSFTHGYDHLALDPVGRKLFLKRMESKTLDIYDLDRHTWSRSSTAPVSNFQVATGVEWFPDVGKLVHLDVYNNFMYYTPSSNSWSSVGGALSGLGDYHNFAEYSQKHKVVIGGGGNGSKRVYRLDASGNVKRMSDAPTNVGITASVLTSDPVSGNFLMISGNGRFYEFDPINDLWTTLQVTIPNILMGRAGEGEWGLVATPLSRYGVVFFARSSYNGAEAVYLYRHQAGTGQALKVPKEPTNLDAQ